MKVEILQTVDSTNEYIKRYLAKKQDVIVCAKRQSGGKGTKGRTFLSEEGGVYLSALNFYENFPARNAFLIMAHAAVSVCKTLERFGAEPEIKWANDVLVCGKKICGILIENFLEGENIAKSIVGIGLNITNDLSGLEEIAIRLVDVSRKAVDAETVRNVLIEEFSRPTDFSEYKRYIKFLGRQILVTEGEAEYFATAKDVLQDGRLEIDCGGAIRALSAAEIRIKF